MARVAVRMLLNDRLRTLATIAGVVFSLILVNQNIATFDFLLSRNTAFVDHAGADIWIVPPGTTRLDSTGGSPLPVGALMEAKVTPGVAWAEPVVWGHASVKLPNGGAEAMSLVGVRLPLRGGGPWNMVAGSTAALSAPDTVIVEDSKREAFGGVNIGSTIEVNRRRVRVGGFTWGLLPFGPPMSFAEYDLARELLQVDSDRVHFVMVRLEPGTDRARVVKELKSRIPVADVMTAEEVRKTTIIDVTFKQGVGPLVGGAAVIGLIIGFAIVSLMMFSSVLENLREFATMKAMGATNGDLARLLFVQAMTFATIGSVVGVALVCRIVMASRSASFNLVLRPQFVAASVLVVALSCIVASVIALMKIRKVEPAQVFR